jgi:hypothetical protein
MRRLGGFRRRRPSATAPASSRRLSVRVPGRLTCHLGSYDAAGDEDNERDEDGHDDAEPQRQPAERNQWRSLRLALAEFLHEAMRLLSGVRREPLRLLAELRVQVVVGVARGRALA